MGRKSGYAAREARFALRLLLWLVGGLAAMLVGVFFLYLAQGFNSVEVYQPPIGPVMAFEFNLAELGGVVIAAVTGFAVILRQVQALRERGETPPKDQG